MGPESSSSIEAATREAKAKNEWSNGARKENNPFRGRGLGKGDWGFGLRIKTQLGLKVSGLPYRYCFA